MRIILMSAALALLACAPAAAPREAAMPLYAPPPTPPSALSSAPAAPPSAAEAPIPAIAPPPLAPILAKHRAALGGDVAIAKAARMRMRAKAKLFGVDGTTTEIIDGDRHRSELSLPAIPLTALDVWDGKTLVALGVNGDVRDQGANEIASEKTTVAILSLAYMRPDFTGSVEAIERAQDGAASFDRILVKAKDGAPTELWLDESGLVSRRIEVRDGLKTTALFASYKTIAGLAIPDRWTVHSSSEAHDRAFEMQSVELLSSVDAGTFARPAPRGDVTFPKGTTHVTMPLALSTGRHILLEARLGGRIGVFILDSGASSTVFDTGFLAAIGVKGKGELVQAAGLFKGMSFARVPSLELGGIVVAPQTVISVGMRGVLPNGIDGILGYDLLSRIVTTIDYPDGWITFAAPSPPPPTSDAIVVPFELERTMIRVPATLNGKPAGTFEIDTGNGGDVTINHAASAADLVPKNHPLRFVKGVVFGTGAAAGYRTHADVAIGSGSSTIRWAEAPILLLDPKDPAASTIRGDGNLGITWLSHFEVTIDYGNRQLRLKQRIPFRPASAHGTFGISSDSSKGKALVDDVAVGWAGDRAGIKVGDEIVDVDGVSAKAMGDLIGRAFREPTPGEARSLHMRRGDKVIEVKLVADPAP